MGINNFLLDPNIAYLVLVATGLLLFHAIIIPGTGMIELTTVFFLIFTAYQVYYLPFNLWALFLLLLGLLPFVIAIRKKQGSAWIYLACAIFFFEAGSIFLYPGENWWLPAVNPLLAIVVTLLTSTYLWIIMHKSIEAWKAPPIQNLENVIGKTGEARTHIHTEGTVYVSGELWSAKSDEPIEVGTTVKVLSREGIIVRVTPLRSVKE